MSNLTRLIQANLPYVLWIVAYNTTFLIGYLFIQILFFPSPNTPYDDAVPWVLEAINRNGLAIFLVVRLVWILM
jgi:phosphatidylinositol glycan class W